MTCNILPLYGSLTYRTLYNDTPFYLRSYFVPKMGTHILENMLIYHSLNMSEFVLYIILDKAEINLLFHSLIKYSLYSKAIILVSGEEITNLSRARSDSARSDVR